VANVTPYHRCTPSVNVIVTKRVIIANTHVRVVRTIPRRIRRRARLSNVRSVFVKFEHVDFLRGPTVTVRRVYMYRYTRICGDKICTRSYGMVISKGTVQNVRVPADNTDARPVAARARTARLRASYTYTCTAVFFLLLFFSRKTQ
jgi:hypothetical protein